jgi:hypothetical protein
VLIHEHPADVLLPEQHGLVLAVDIGDRLDIRRCVRCIVSNGEIGSMSRSGSMMRPEVAGFIVSRRTL